MKGIIASLIFERPFGSNDLKQQTVSKEQILSIDSKNLKIKFDHNICTCKSFSNADFKWVKCIILKVTRNYNVAKIIIDSEKEIWISEKGGAIMM